MPLFIRLFTNFWTHRKTVKLKTFIGEDAYWVPPRLWSYAADHQIDGDFSSYSSEVLADILGCSKHATSMLQALHDSGFMENGKIKDWEYHNKFHAVNSERARKAAIARHSKEKKEAKKRKEEDTDSEQACSSMLQASNEPKRNHRFSKPSKEMVVREGKGINLPESECVAFWDWYESVGWVIGKGHIPMANWTSSLIRWRDRWLKDGKGNDSKTQIRPFKA